MPMSMSRDLWHPRCGIIVLGENVLMVSFAVKPPEPLAWLSDFGGVKDPDVKLQIAVDRKTAEKGRRGMCQWRLITAHCFHPHKCLGLHLHPTQQFFCYQAVNFSSPTLFFFFLAFLHLVYWITEKKRFSPSKKRIFCQEVSPAWQACGVLNFCRVACFSFHHNR